VLSGGQAPGGHNVISGLYDYIKSINPESALIGFLDGPKGLFTGKYVVVDDKLMNNYRNMGGFDMIGSGRDKIETPEQFAGAAKYARELNLHGIVVIGGDDSNTNAAVLAEYFAANGSPTKVVGAPKTIDGDLKVPGSIDISFGFDTACKVSMHMFYVVTFFGKCTQMRIKYNGLIFSEWEFDLSLVWIQLSFLTAI
jgi:diphosphate-dependent phosphofructokinase